ncbi:ubiquitin-conjugating enzyme E2 [Polyangium fumosum]|uniref:UBC core domain-containing protein n=1 Tax=Polyangium fumosum TaxID=889272 RepID=A0A4U1J777_9BACT|nr:ubiquitin-conjugating enzyme E2 [Polyangium fumosum]TKD03187.1 hypothetical protein E8A74_27130 [Polyangium fumosum]
MSNAGLLLDTAEAVGELGRVAETREDALTLLGGAILAGVPGLEGARLPRFEGPAHDYFQKVAEIVEQGGGRAGVSALLAEASRLFPGKRGKGREAGFARESGAQALPISIVLQEDLGDEQILAIVKASRGVAASLGRRAALDLVSREEGGLCVSFEGASEEEAETIVRSLRASIEPSMRVEVARESHAFRDYFLDPLQAEGPDGQRFVLDHVRASTRLVDVAQAILGAYEEAFWPMGKGEKALPVVDLRRPGERGARRLFSQQTLHDAGVQPFDLLEIHPERRAGSVNPFLLTESLAMVKNQILEFAGTHQGFEVQANALDVPTEYLVRFRAPGFAPGSPPRRVEAHEVLLVMPPDFPVKAPEAYFQREVFHPNVDAKTGLVCLGVLAESYRPGLHFGTVCQMLVDMASYRNYELREVYNPEAHAWAASPEGQAAITASGGRSWSELEGGAARRARSVRIERLSA